MVRGNNDAYDTNKMAEEFTHQFLDQAFSVGQQVTVAAAHFCISYFTCMLCTGHMHLDGLYLS